MKRILILVSITLCTVAATAEDKRRSGFDFMGPDTQAMQRDDGSNPAMLAVLEGETLWNAAPESSEPSCAGCHDDAAAAMAGVAARYPALDRASNEVLTLEGRVRTCRERHQKATPFPYESRDLLALTALVALQSRGKPIAPSDPAIATTVSEGKRLFSTRLGQLNLSCAQCHDDNAGHRLGAAPIPEAHPTGYPIFRLEWQSIGSLQRRIRGCLTGVRAEPFAYGAPEMRALEAFLRERAAGMRLESPGVRP